MKKSFVLILPDFDKKNNRCRLNQYYFDSILNVGAIPFAMPLLGDQTLLETYFSMADGIILSGGSDINPADYGEKTELFCGEYNKTLDLMYAQAIDHAVKNKKPCLCICRGMQALNVYFGGTLYQDLQIQNKQFFNHMPKIDRTEYAHPITIVDDSLLQKITGQSKFMVNSIHHQGVKALGRNLVAMAHAEDGVIEAIHYEGYILGLQWHPEALAHKDDNNKSLFRYFVSKINL